MASGGVDASAATTCRLLRNDAAIVIQVDDNITTVLGWRPEDLVGSPSTSFIHPEDQASAVAAWFQMLAAPGASLTWEGRYRTASGRWQWVRTHNTNRLDDPDQPVVISLMSAITVEMADIAEELRERKQVLARLADALPVGLIQFDATGAVTFTNDRLHTLVALPVAATVDAQLATVAPDDAEALADAISAALEGKSVDGVELRFAVTSTRPDSDWSVCQLSLRPLTNPDGDVTGAIGCLNDVTDSARLRRDLEHRVATDQMTGCLNRAATLELLDTAVIQSQTSGTGLAVIYVDLDGFKRVNDTYGHLAGDAVLTDAASALRDAVRFRDHVGRIGGDEFLIVCPAVNSRSRAAAIARRIRDAARGEIAHADRRIPWSATLGLAWDESPRNADELVAAADMQMYRRKHKS